MQSSRFLAGVLAVLAASCGAVLFACGGAELSPLDQAPGFGNTGLDASLPNTPDSSSSSQPPGSGGKDTGTSKDSAPSPSPPADSASGEDSASDDTGTGEDSAPPTDLGIPCGTGKKPCDPNLKVCCVGPDNGSGPTFECELPTSCGNKGGFSLPCASSADCALVASNPPGSVCCVTELSGSSTAGSVACVDPSQCTGPTQAWMCDPTAPQCPSGDRCTASVTTIPPYSICMP